MAVFRLEKPGHWRTGRDQSHLPSWQTSGVVPDAAGLFVCFGLGLAPLGHRAGRPAFLVGHPGWRRTDRDRYGDQLDRRAETARSSIIPMMTLSRDAAWQLLTEWTQSESLRKHALAVEAAVRGYARQQGANEEEWGVVALLHDFDYERYPTLGDHPNKGCEHLRSLGYPEWVMRAILSHASEITAIQPESPMEKTLVACDELAGFVTAASLVRPSKSVLDL